MTINDQIRDEKLQYNINREGAKISALSSGKIHKYEYLTGEDILPSNQQRITEKTKFKIKDKLKKLKKKYSFDGDNTPFISKQKEIFNWIVDERLEKINGLDERVNSDDLIYRYKGKTADAKFDEFNNALDKLIRYEMVKQTYLM